jgi:hypothetical protein
MDHKAIARKIWRVGCEQVQWNPDNIEAILREAFPEKPEPAKDAQTLAELLAARGYIQECDTARVVHVLSLARPEPSSGEPLLPWRDSLEIAIAECTKLQRYLASESAVRREAQARAENAEAAWEAAVEQIKIEQGMKEKAEVEAKALRGLLEKWAVFTEYMARDDALLAPGTARLFDEVSAATIAALAQGEGGKL